MPETGSEDSALRLLRLGTEGSGEAAEILSLMRDAFSLTESLKTTGKVVLTVSACALFSGLFGGAPAADHEIVSFHTASFGMTRAPTYSFALQKRSDVWLFSASCFVSGQQAHYTSFSLFPIPAEEAEAFLALLRSEGEISRLRRRCRLNRFMHASDAPMHSTGITFRNGKCIEKAAAIGERARGFLHALADRHCGNAERLEIKEIFFCRSCMDHSASFSFDLEKDDCGVWHFSFDCTLGCDLAHTEVSGQPICAGDAEEILRIVREEQLVSRVVQYTEPPDDGISVLDETTYRTSFAFSDGRSFTAPIDAGGALSGAFRTLAEAKHHPR